MGCTNKKTRGMIMCGQNLLVLEHGKTYKNRKRGEVEIFYDGKDPNYPFTDRLGVTYNRYGKVYIGKECDYDLIEECE